MDTLAITLIIISAIMHVGWNLFSQQRQVTLGFFFIACLTAAVVLSPFLYFLRAGFTALPPIFWLFVIGSGIFEGLYYVNLCGAYRVGDLSVTYPLLRAVPVVLVALLSLAFGGGGGPQGIGLVGVCFVAAGCLMLPLTSFHHPRFSVYFLPASFLAIAAGIGTAGYSLADGKAMQLLVDLPSAQLHLNSGALFFLALKTISSTTALGIILLTRPVERNWLRSNWRVTSLSAGLTGMFIFGAYGLVLAAMALASNVSYVVAFRQLSIPLGAAVGFLVNKERLFPPRMAGVAVITIGLIMVAGG